MREEKKDGEKEKERKRERKKEEESKREKKERMGETYNIPLTRFQSMAAIAAFSRGSPTVSPSRWASEWQEARTHCVSKGVSCTATSPSPFPSAGSSQLRVHIQAITSTHFPPSLPPSFLPSSLPPSLPPSPPQSSDALDDKVVTGECACLVKTADVHFASERNSKWLRAVDPWARTKSM